MALQKGRVRIVLWTLGLALSAVLAGRWVWDVVESRALNAELNTIQTQLALSPTSAKTESVTPQIARAENRAVVVSAALDLFELTKQEDALFSRLISQTASEPQAVDRELWTAACNRNRVSFTLLRTELPTRPASDWNFDRNAFGSGEQPNLLRLVGLLRAASACARLEARLGSADEGLRLGLAGLDAANSLESKRRLIAASVQEHGRIAAAHALREILSTTSPSRELLQAWASPARWGDGIESLRQGMLDEISQLAAKAHRLDGQQDSRSSNFDEHDGWWSSPIVSWCERPYLRSALRASLRNLAELMAQLDGLSIHDLLGPASSPSLFARLHPGYSQVFSHLQPSARRAAEEVRLARTAVTLRLYRLDHGAYPDALEALVPDYLPELSVDSVSKQPPRYVRQGSGFLLASSAFSDGEARDETESALLQWAIPL